MNKKRHYSEANNLNKIDYISDFYNITKKRKLNEVEPRKSTRSKVGNKKIDDGISEIEVTPTKVAKGYQTESPFVLRK
jgi:hypothetical protein